jgi:hypothetical protein
VSKKVRITSVNRDGYLCYYDDYLQLGVKEVIIAFPIAKNYRRDHAFVVAMDALGKSVGKQRHTLTYEHSEGMPTDFVKYKVWSHHYEAEQYMLHWMSGMQDLMLYSCMFNEDTKCLTITVSYEHLPTIIGLMT